MRGVEMKYYCNTCTFNRPLWDPIASIQVSGVNGVFNLLPGIPKQG